jgi:hypothetical protein
MRNFVDGINPSYLEDQRARRDAIAVKSALREHARALAKLIPANNDPSTLGVQNVLEETKDLARFADASDTTLSRVTFEGVWDGPINTTALVSVTDSVFKILDDLDPTKIAQFQVSGLTTGTTRTYTLPDVSGTIPTLENAHTITGQWTFNGMPQTHDLIIRVPTGGGGGLGTGAFLFEDGDTGFTVEIATASGLTGSHTLQLPDVDGELVLTGGAQTLSAKTLNTGTILKSSTLSTGTSFSDQSNAARRLRVVLTGASANNHAIAFLATAARTWTFPDASITMAGSASALTSGRVPFATTGGILTDDSDLTFATDTLSATKVAMSSLTSGRIPVASTAGLLVDDSDLTFATDTLTATKIVAPTSIQVGGGAVVTKLDFGTYTPTLTNVANIAASTTYQAQWMQVGTTVTVSGKCDIDPTAGGAFQLGISLPVASTFGAEEDCAGVAYSTTIAEGAGINADAANDRAALFGVATVTTSQPRFYTFTYQVI